MAKVADRNIPGPAGDIPVRIYTPAGKPPFPVLVYFHGGGFVICDLDTHDAPLRALTNRAGCITVSVDYRRAPEHKFPAAHEDCYAATVWAAENAASFGGDSHRLAVGGDSGGGNLAAAIPLMARDRGKPHISFQLLIYPAVANDLSFPSIDENGEGYFLTKAGIIWFGQHYASSPADFDNPYMSPLRAEDLHGLPPAFLATCEYDPLRDEGAAYAKRLRESGVVVEYKCYEGGIHAIFNFAGVIDLGKQLIEDCAAAVRTGLGD